MPILNRFCLLSLSLGLGISTLTGCTTEALNKLRKPDEAKFTTENLLGLTHMTRQVALKESRKSISALRYDALKETGTSIGARSGLAWQAKKIDKFLENNRIALGQIYNFDMLILPHNVLPPVLTQGNDTVHLADERTIRVADRMFKIEQQARFVSAPPHWRDYLYLNFPTPEAPDASLLPKNRQEVKIWRRYVTQGWGEGIKQANTIFANSISRLTAQYKGMLLYRKLLAMHMVSPPYVAKTELGIIGGGDEMTINDNVLRITALPQLQANSDKWQAVVANSHVHSHAAIPAPLANHEAVYTK